MGGTPDAEAATPEGVGQRRPEAADIPEVLDLVCEGKSLRAACRKLGLHAPSTHTFIQADKGLSEQYTRAREQRGECYQEQALSLALAAATGSEVEIEGKKVKIEPRGAAVALDAIKWAVGRMQPKGGPVQRIDLTARTRNMTDDEIADELAALATGEAAAGT